MKSKILDSAGLSKTLQKIRNSHSTAVVLLCHGTFDLVHPGHLRHFKEARKFGDYLIVSVTADAYAKKGPNHPFFNEFQRANFLAALDVIDYVHITHSESAVDVINLVRPNFYVKGPNYRSPKKEMMEKLQIEIRATEKIGGEIRFTEDYTASGSMLVNKAMVSQDNEIRRWADEFKLKYPPVVIEEWIDKLSTVKVTILGESIIDIYTDCRPLAKSSKDPILVFQRFESRKFKGGVLAIADSCHTWSQETSVVSVCGKDFKDHLIDLGGELPLVFTMYEVNDRPTIVKHRFVDMNSGNRVFEYYDYNPEYLEEDLQLKIAQAVLSKVSTEQLLLLADYGHGFFGESLVNDLCRSRAFLAVNAQSNAGNRGFNTFSKYSRIDFLSLNGGELELELRKKNLNYEEIVPQIMKLKACKYAVVTLGGEGLLAFDSSGEFVHIPALASKVVDKVGAGDSVLAIASMLALLNAPKEIIGVLSSVVAAFEVSQMGHQASMSIDDMKKIVYDLLG